MKKILLLGLFISSLFAQEVTIKIKKMHCPLCTTMVKKVISKIDGVSSVKVRLNTKKAQVVFDESKTNTDVILKAIKTTSYTGVVVED